MSLLLQARTKNITRLCIGIPMTGLIRTEWALARFGQIIPCNWSYADRIIYLNQVTPLGYAVAEARNIIVDEVVRGDFITLQCDKHISIHRGQKYKAIICATNGWHHKNFDVDHKLRFKVTVCNYVHAEETV